MARKTTPPKKDAEAKEPEVTKTAEPETIETSEASEASSEERPVEAPAYPPEPTGLAAEAAEAPTSGTCANCERASVFVDDRPGVNPVEYCALHIPVNLRENM